MNTQDLKKLQSQITPGDWKPCRAHEDFSGPLFEIEPEDRDLYNERPFVAVRAASRNVTNAHDLHVLTNANATAIALVPQLIREVLELREALQKSCEMLDEVRTGDDFECECWDVSESGEALLKRHETGKEAQ